MYSAYSVVQLGPSPVQDTSKPICKGLELSIFVIKACTADSVILCTQAGTEAGFMFTFVILFQAQCVHHEY